MYIYKIPQLFPYNLWLLATSSLASYMCLSSWIFFSGLVTVYYRLWVTISAAIGYYLLCLRGVLLIRKCSVTVRGFISDFSPRSWIKCNSGYLPHYLHLSQIYLCSFVCCFNFYSQNCGKLAISSYQKLRGT